MGPEPELGCAIVDGRNVYGHGERTVQMLVKHVAMDWLTPLSAHGLSQW